MQGCDHDDNRTELAEQRMPDWLDFARELLGMCAGEAVAELLTDSEMLKLSGYLEKLTDFAREQGWNDGWEGGWRRGYSDCVDFCTDYLRLLEEPRRPERGT